MSMRNAEKTRYIIDTLVKLGVLENYWPMKPLAEEPIGGDD